MTLDHLFVAMRAGYQPAIDLAIDAIRAASCVSGNRSGEPAAADVFELQRSFGRILGADTPPQRVLEEPSYPDLNSVLEKIIELTRVHYVEPSGRHDAGSCVHCLAKAAISPTQPVR